jgi:hypothetical protein
LKISQNCQKHNIEKKNSVLLVYGCSIDIIHGMCNGIAKPN